MKFLSFFTVLLFAVSCQKSPGLYGNLSIQQCDSLLRHTALSSRERAALTIRYAHLYTPGRGFQGTILTSKQQDSCLYMLREALSLAPNDLKTELKITILPFLLPKLTPYNIDISKNVRKLMSEIENNSMPSEQEAWYLNYKAQFYTIQRAPEKAFQFCEEARKKFRLNKNLQGEFCTLTQLSMLYSILQDYPNAIRYCDSAVNLPDHTLSKGDRQRLYCQYSMLYANTGQLEKAIAARKESGCDTIQNSTLVNLYISAKQYDQALNIIKRQRKLYKNNAFRLNYFLRMEAEIYEAKGEYQQAATIRNEAIQMAEKNSLEVHKHQSDIPGIPVAFAPIYATQAAWIWKQGNRKKAIQLLRKAEILTLRSNIIRKEHLKILKQLTQYYQETGDYRSAFITNLHLDSIKNQYSTLQLPEDFQNALAQHEVEILNTTLDKQKAEFRMTQHTQFYLILLIFLLGICIFLSILYHQSIHKK